jgi:phosphatidate cytidylyltransferase
MTMTDADPARQLPVAGSGGDLMARVVSALVLVPLALGSAWLGGAAFVGFWSVAAIVVMWEWTLLVTGSNRLSVLMIGIASVVLALGLAVSSVVVDDRLHDTRLTAALIVLVMGMLAAGAVAPRGGGPWVAAGIPYAGAMGLAPIILRSDDGLGFIAIVFLFAIVWSTDIAAYFVGRTFGGPKLAPRLSPKKTWSGCLGGLAGGVAAAMLVVQVTGVGSILAAALTAFVLSGFAQVGDLFESALKRRFGVKDSSTLIPGHGGLMDRLDSFVAAAVLACIIGLARGGIDAPARGLLIW